MTAPLPALPTTASTWDQALYAFLVEKGNRSGSRRTVESYSRMLWHFFKATTPDQVTPAVVLAYAHGIGLSSKLPALVTIGARIACLSSYFHTVYYSYRGKGGKRGRRELPRRAWEAIRRTLDDWRKEIATMDRTSRSGKIAALAPECGMADIVSEIEATRHERERLAAQPKEDDLVDPEDPLAWLAWLGTLSRRSSASTSFRVRRERRTGSSASK